MDILLETSCNCCGKKFKRRKFDILRAQKNSRPLYCSLSCTAKVNNIKYPRDRTNMKPPPVRYWQDEFSDFRRHLARIRFNKQRSYFECSITLQDLKEQWDFQKGKCIYTGVQLIPTKIKGKRADHLYGTSLDRIDSVKGYIKGNIQFISITANYAKNNMSHEQMVLFCKIIRDYWSGK